MHFFFAGPAFCLPRAICRAPGGAGSMVRSPLYIFRSICLSIYLSISLLICLSIYPSIYIYIYLPTYLSIHPSINQSIHLSVCLSISCMHVHPLTLSCVLAFVFWGGLLFPPARNLAGKPLPLNPTIYIYIYT